MQVFERVISFSPIDIHLWFQFLYRLSNKKFFGRNYEKENEKVELRQLETTDLGDEETFSTDSFAFLGADGGKGNSSSSSTSCVHKAGGL